MKRAFEIILLAFALFACFAVNADPPPGKLAHDRARAALDRWQAFYMNPALHHPARPDMDATNAAILAAWKSATNDAARTNFTAQMRRTIDLTAKDAKGTK